MCFRPFPLVHRSYRTGRRRRSLVCHTASTVYPKTLSITRQHRCTTAAPNTLVSLVMTSKSWQPGFQGDIASVDSRSTLCSVDRYFKSHQTAHVQFDGGFASLVGILVVLAKSLTLCGLYPPFRLCRSPAFAFASRFLVSHNFALFRHCMGPDTCSLASAFLPDHVNPYAVFKATFWQSVPYTL
jgi:hypothetical protein